MNLIRLLPEQVANQIAAGEVVERPASVVKELVENSLDAEPSRITVEILAAGRSLIRVTDDGCGMSRDDALLCLERHATSKIRQADDLSRIRTMGFRGEAVPSIASISRFALTTRERQTDAPTAVATQIVINGGKILEVKEAGAPAGTSVEVRNLFFNVPARRKFLRSDETERGHIQHWLTTAALAHPHIGFTLIMEGRTVWHLPALPRADSIEDQLKALQLRFRLLIGAAFLLVPVSATAELAGAPVAPSDPTHSTEFSAPALAGVWGWIGAPGVSRATREDQFLFVNRRPVENRGLSAALIEGYHNSLMKGRYPLSCLFLEVDPAEVDVNIHPAKREVKFHRERAIRWFVADAVRSALKGWHSREGIPGPEPTSSPTLAPTDEAIPTHPEFPELPSPQPQPSAPAASPPGPKAMVGPGPGGQGVDPTREPKHSSPPADPTASGSAQPAVAVNPPSRPPTAPALPPTHTGGPPPLLSIPLRIVGVVGRLYVVLESDRGLVLLDQHAAHERVLYEQMLRRLEHGDVAPAQRLLLPETLELPPRDAAFIRENLATLGRLGVGLSEFGDRTFLLDALPPFVKSTDPRKFALELVDELRAAGASVNTWRLGESVVAKTVCRHSVKANDLLAGPELEGLLRSLRQCDMPYTCPHGRPTLIEMGFRELEKKFGRVAG